MQRAFVVQCVFVSYGKRVFPRKLVEHRLIIVKIIVVAFAKPDFRFQKFQNEIFCVFDAAVEVNAADNRLKQVAHHRRIAVYAHFRLGFAHNQKLVKSCLFYGFGKGFFADDCRAHTGELSLVKRRVSFHQSLGNDERKYAVAQKFKVLI